MKDTPKAVGLAPQQSSYRSRSISILTSFLHIPWRTEDELLGGHIDHTAAFLAQRDRIGETSATDVFGQAIEAEVRRLHAAGLWTRASDGDSNHGQDTENPAGQFAAFDPETFVTTQARGSPSDIAMAAVVQCKSGSVAIAQAGSRMADDCYASQLESMSPAQCIAHMRVRDHVLKGQRASSTRDVHDSDAPTRSHAPDQPSASKNHAASHNNIAPQSSHDAPTRNSDASIEPLHLFITGGAGIGK